MSGAAEEKPYPRFMEKKLVSSENGSFLEEMFLKLGEMLLNFILHSGDFVASAYDAVINDPNHPKAGRSYYGPGDLLAKTSFPLANDYVVTKLLYTLPEDHRDILSGRVNIDRLGPRVVPWKKEPPFIGYVALSRKLVMEDQLREIVVAWRGTNTIDDKWLAVQNLSRAFNEEEEEEVKDEDDEDEDEDAHVAGKDEAAKVANDLLNMFAGTDATAKASLSITQTGDASAKDQLHSQIQELVERCVKAGEKAIIRCVGHGAGGALAILGALYIVTHKLCGDFPVMAVVFGCPKIGNQAFVNCIKEHAANLGILSIRNTHDLQPTLPISKDYIGMDETTGAVVVVEVDFNKSHALHEERTTREEHDLEALLHVVAGWNWKDEEFKSNKEVKEIRSPALVNKYTNLLKKKKVPAFWGQVQNKGMRRQQDGKWKPDLQEKDHAPPPNLDDLFPATPN